VAAANDTRVGQCTVCGSPDLHECMRIDAMPIYCNVLWPTADAANNARRGDIDLVCCGHCGHLFNRVFDPGLMDYTESYENSLHFSGRFNEYAGSLARRLVDQYGIRGKEVIELGCGKGDFLAMVCAAGDNRGTGFDRSYELERDGGASSGNLTFVRDYYSEKYAHLPADLICCRHVLEHIQFPGDLLGTLSRVLERQPRALLYFEVPNALYTLEDLGIWDLIYEHCSYFTPTSLERLFSGHGFEILALDSTFGGQFLYVEATRGVPRQSLSAVGRHPVEKVAVDVSAFGKKYRSKVAEWTSILNDWRAEDRRAVVWGAGSKGVTFLNVLNGVGDIAHVVDVNPHKHGRFVPGTGQKVVGPEFLREHQPDRVVVMNAIYLEEIRGMLRELGVDAEVDAV